MHQARIEIDRRLDEAAWRTATRADRGYVARRRAQPGDLGPSRILADFIIGAHAVQLASALLTLDQGV